MSPTTSAHAESSRIEIAPTQTPFKSLAIRVQSIEPSPTGRSHRRVASPISMITIHPFITMVPAWLRHAVLFAVGLIAQASLLSAAQVEDGIIAIVNSDLIMLSEMKRELAPERERIQKEYRGDVLARRLKTAEYMALTSMIERKLQLQEAKVRGIAVTDQEVRQAVQQVKQQGRTIDETNPADMKNVREQLTLLRIVDREVRSGVMVADSDMKRYFQEHRDRFALSEEYTLSEIFIQPRSPDDTADARGKVREVMAQLKQGESFEDLALRFSDGPSASHGGRLGLVRQGELLPEIERTIASLVPGGISDLIETSEGFHIVRLEDKKPKQFRPYEQVRTEIQGLVFQQKSEDVFQSWLADLKNKAYIEIKFESALSGLPTTAPAPRPLPTSKE
ncbi:MAG TPA: peptidylprolyl isomerase [Nitrospiraceae bacterium]|nr:peptidylprolyl isomerase [Nitrospiraceae bacterium]